MNLYLACGKDRVEGYHHVDVSPACAPDQVWDLLDFSKRWPWHDVKHILVKHFVEHIPHGDGGKDYFIRFFDRCWHILRPGGDMTVTYPWYTSIGAFSDPTHRRIITPLTFSYLSKAWLAEHKIDHYAQDCDFDIIQNVSGLAVEHEQSSPDQQGSFLRTQWNAAHEGTVVLKARK